MVEVWAFVLSSLSLTAFVKGMENPRSTDILKIKRPVALVGAS